MLDFDFEKLCSVSLNNINIYGCLTCGKYFQGFTPCLSHVVGRGTQSNAYYHSMNEDHHVFINLSTLKAHIYRVYLSVNCSFRYTSFLMVMK